MYYIRRKCCVTGSMFTSLKIQSVPAASLLSNEHQNKYFCRLRNATTIKIGN